MFARWIRGKMNSLTAFVLAFASTAFIGMVARYAARYFASEKASRIAAFGVALGYALGRFSYSGAAAVEDVPAISAAFGAFAGLVAAWAWLLRRDVGELTGADD